MATLELASSQLLEIEELTAMRSTRRRASGFVQLLFAPDGLVFCWIRAQRQPRLRIHYTGGAGCGNMKGACGSDAAAGETETVGQTTTGTAMDQSSKSLEPTEQLKLANALADALVALPKARSPDNALFWQMLTLRDTPESAPLALTTLHDVVRGLPSLDMFKCSIQYALGYERQVDFGFLVRWLVSRAQQVGPQQAVFDLNRYLQLEQFELTEVLAVDGITLATALQVGDHQLIPWRDLEETDTKYQMVVRDTYTSNYPTVAVARPHSIVPIQDFQIARPETAPHSIEPTMDLLRCSTLVANTGIRLIYHWFEPPPWAPWDVVSSHFRVEPSMAAPVVIDASSARTVADAFARLGELEDPQRVRLRVPLDRLNRSYISAYRPVESAIDLGIAYESLFAPTKLSEGIGFAVRTRAARFLESSIEMRRRVNDIVKCVYDLRSRAVHSGRFDADGKRKWQDLLTVSDTLAKGRDILGRSLLKVILEGEPDWEDFDIS